MLVGLGSAGAIALVLIGFIAFSVFGGEDEPRSLGGDASPTPTASPSAEPTTAATPEPTASPEPTPKPTPAGPPVELAMGDWATVTVDELQVRAGAGENQASTYRLVRGAVMTVSEGPQVVNGANWYRIASLGGVTGWVTSGWVADPYLETILNDPVLIRCGEVANPVFDMVDGAPVAREVVRVGDFAVPSNKLDVTTLAAIELARGIRAEVCVTAQVGSDGLPVLRSEPRANACGHAVADGQAFWLRPAADQEADVSSSDQGPGARPPDPPGRAGRESAVEQPAVAADDDVARGCRRLRPGEHQHRLGRRRRAIAARRIEQCSIVTEYNDLNLKLHPAAGGPTAWIKLPKDGSSRDDIPLERPIEVYVSTDVNPDGISSYASSPFNYEREECA